MTTRYLTVVFAINDEDSFKDEQSKFHKKMLDEKQDSWGVSAMSLGDEMTKLELMEQAVNECDDKYHIQEVCGNILSTPLQNLEGKTIDDFE